MAAKYRQLGARGSGLQKLEIEYNEDSDYRFDTQVDGSQSPPAAYQSKRKCKFCHISKPLFTFQVSLVRIDIVSSPLNSV